MGSAGEGRIVAAARADRAEAAAAVLSTSGHISKSTSSVAMYPSRARHGRLRSRTRSYDASGPRRTTCLGVVCSDGRKCPLNAVNFPPPSYLEPPKEIP
jgi:hypothetical protein